MSVTFTKLFSSITESTIWCEDSDTRVVWVTMLAMSDKYGRVWASIPGLAKRASVSLSSTESALSKFLAPDKYSRSNTYDPAEEGRRIKPIQGGWKLINYPHYRGLRDEDERRAYKAEWARKNREKQRISRGQQMWTNSTNVDSSGHNAEAEADKSNTNPPLPPPPSRSKVALTVRDRRKLNDEIWRLMEKNCSMPFEEALRTACAEMLIPLDAAKLAVSEAGLKDALPTRKRNQVEF